MYMKIVEILIEIYTSMSNVVPDPAWCQQYIKELFKSMQAIPIQPRLARLHEELSGHGMFVSVGVVSI